MDSDDEGDTSVLGRHDHWESVYTRELSNLRQHGDRGEVWFGDAVLQATADFAKQQLSCHPHRDISSARVLDVGTGNGTLALELRKRAFQHITGSDYSERSVELAREVALQAGEGDITWVGDDILNTQLQSGWDMILDKGTLDAIGLRSDADCTQFEYVDYVRTYPVFQFGGQEGSRVCTVAFKKKMQG
ncbi:hypothetical protein WJX73_001319 [Symbiochloris irregularis]|uniref:Methyltransferase domain-containing protein n=1 Tax=Symbiochloris irregularis TaxID=706552 RepID=A0AAW1NZL9_9CHLO